MKIKIKFSISPLFCKKGTTHKISILQDKQEGGSILDMTNRLRGRMSPTCLGYSWRWSCQLFTYHRGPLVEWFTTHNSIYLKVAISPFLQNRGDIITISCFVRQQNAQLTLKHKVYTCTQSHWCLQFLSHLWYFLLSGCENHAYLSLFQSSWLEFVQSEGHVASRTARL
jgi:hypothetical protein